MVKRLRQTFISNGVECTGYLYLPGGLDALPPCVVMGQGFGGVQDGSMAATARHIADAGLAAFTFDYRSFGESRGDPRQVISIADQLDDWHAAIRHVRSLKAVDTEKLAIWGSSLGGAHVVYVAAKDEALKAVVSQVPFNGFPSKVEGRASSESMGLLAAALKDWWRGKTGRSPSYVRLIGPVGEPALMTFAGADRVIASQQNSTFRNEVAPRVILDMAIWYRPSRRAHLLKMPILVCLAQADKHTPANLGRKIVDNAPLGELRRYPCTHFEFYEDAIRRVVTTDQISFLRTHLLGFSTTNIRTEKS